MRKPWGAVPARYRIGGFGAAVAAATALSLAVPAAGGAKVRATTASGKLKVAFLYENPVTDLGWDTAMYEGEKAVEKEYGSKLSITTKVVPDGPQDGTTEKELISEGYKLIFATSYAEQTYTLPIAKANPKVHFVQAEAAKTLPNVSTYFTEDEDGFYLAGMAAAEESKKSTLGFVGGFPISDCLAEVNGFILGVEAVKPKDKVRVTWTDNWDSVSVAQNATSALINAGAGAIAFDTTGAGPGEVAGRDGIPWVGYEAEQKSAAPSEYVTGVIWELEPLFLEDVKEQLSGTWKTSTSYVTMATKTEELDETGKLWSKLPASVKSEIAKKYKAYKAGTSTPFTGPMYNEAGKLVVKKGTKLDDAQVAKMNYLVKGAIGSASS